MVFPVGDTAAALRLATQNALASARAAGPLERLRCVVLAGFVTTAIAAGLDPALLEESLVLLKSADGDSAKVASSSSALEANVQAYLANYPG